MGYSSVLKGAERGGNSEKKIKQGETRGIRGKNLIARGWLRFDG